MDSPQIRPKIAILCSTLVTGGAEMVVRSLALGLPRHGIKTEVICLRKPGMVGEELKNIGIAVHSGVSNGRYDVTAFTKLARILGTGRNSILLCLDHHDAIFAGALASRIAGVRHRVLCMHSTGLWNKRGTFSFTDRLALPHFERVVALAESHAKYLCKNGGIDEKRIVLIKNGVDTGKFHPESDETAKAAFKRELHISPTGFVVTIAAALRPEKNHMMFVDAAAKVLSSDAGYTFLIAGDGGESARIHEKAIKLGIDGSIRFLGIRKDMERIFSVTDVSVLCSFPVVETFPLTVLEAMSSGLPVISTRVGSIAEMMDDGREGVLIASGDTDALVHSLISLKKDPDLRKTIGANARKRVEKDFSEIEMVRAYAELFSRIIECGKDGL